jgi:hypothetical protein
MLQASMSLQMSVQKRAFLAAEKQQENVQHRLALAQNFWDSISPWEQRQQLLSVPLQ